MESKVKDTVRECTRASDEERVSFGEVVSRLVAAGVERYHTDLMRGEKTYYLPGGEWEAVAGETLATAPAEAFSAAGVEAALRAIQAGAIGYRTFCARIAAAGCVGYMVFIAGRRALYYGRKGETFLEPFPAAK